MDGNGRWATQRSLPRTSGHQAGVEAITRITTECARLGVRYLTLYAFSTENWRRPTDEVAALMGLVLTALEEEIFQKNDIRFRVIGDRSRMPEAVQKKLRDVEKHTAANQAMTLTTALSYSSRWEITEAMRHIAEETAAGTLSPADITADTLSGRMQTAYMPDPDLLIRTGGEQRISNYLLWQIAYTELYFTPTLWPDFNEQDLRAAIDDYSRRQRRYGLTEEQAASMQRA